jgi:hypothetical protein
MGRWLRWFIRSRAVDEERLEVPILAHGGGRIITQDIEVG